MLAMVSVAAVPGAALAQRRAGGRSPGSFRSFTFVGGGFGFPHYFAYNPFLFDYGYEYQ